MGGNQNCALVSVVGSTNEWRPCGRVTFKNSSTRRTIIQVHMWFENDLKDRRTGLWLSLSNFFFSFFPIKRRLCFVATRFQELLLYERGGTSVTPCRGSRALPLARPQSTWPRTHTHKSRHNMKKTTQKGGMTTLKKLFFFSILEEKLSAKLTNYGKSPSFKTD